MATGERMWYFIKVEVGRRVTLDSLWIVTEISRSPTPASLACEEITMCRTSITYISVAMSVLHIACLCIVRQIFCIYTFVFVLPCVDNDWVMYACLC